MFRTVTLSLFFVSKILSFEFVKHPLEKRICYVQGIDDVRLLTRNEFRKCQQQFDQESPMLIFQNQPEISPHEFLDFAKLFDEHRDEEALNSKSSNQSYWQNEQMLQPFDQFPDCKHVAPRGNYFLEDYYGCKNLNVEPGEFFKEHYLWHADTWAHHSKRMNKITAFNVIKQPLIGGETDFISGETVYEKLTEVERLFYRYLIVEVSRESFLKNMVSMDYSGSEYENELDFELSPDFLSESPLIHFPHVNSYEKPSMILTPILIHKIKGLNVDESRKIISRMVKKNLLPHRVSIQWKKGDIAVFNNKLFMHSNTPANNYLKNKQSNQRFLLQTFIPTRK